VTRTNPLAVAHVIGSLDPGGVEMWLLSLFAETRGRGVTHNVVTLGPGPGSLESRAAELGVGVLHCPLRPLPGFSGRFAEALRGTSATVVHSHVHYTSGGLLWLARRRRVAIRIAHGHTTHDGHRPTPLRRAYRRLGRYLIRRHATAGVAVSTECAVALFGRSWPREERFRVIPTGIDLARFAGEVDRAEVRRELGLPPDATLVGQIGRFHPVKNHDFAVRVAAALGRRDPGVHFVFVGEGPKRAAAERRAEELGIRSRCVFTGSVSVGVPRLLAGLDLLLSPSLYEGLPVSLIEAQAVAVPVLASASITRELEAVGGVVRFLDLRDGPEAWATEAQEALKAPRPSPRMARARLAETDFDIRRNARRILELYGISF
jgi:glycosyltransferase involved in cell wall biosynthesis